MQEHDVNMIEIVNYAESHDHICKANGIEKNIHKKEICYANYKYLNFSKIEHGTTHHSVLRVLDNLTMERGS